MNEKLKSSLENAISRDYGNTVGLIVKKNGETLYENYFGGYTPEDSVHVFSVTKSIFVSLVGIALDMGLIGSVSDRVLDYFPDYKVLPGEKTIQNIKISHLLTMTAPYKYDEEPYEEFFSCEDTVRAALDYLGGDKPVGRFNYAGIGGVQILSGILAKAIGRPILDFANEHLFSPLGIDVPQSLHLNSEEEHIAFMNAKTARGWATDAQGNNAAGWGLILRPRDMAKIGELYLNGGAFEGRQIIPESWALACTSKHSRCEEWGLDYGFLWWLLDDDSFAAMGDGGNIIYVNRKKRLTVAGTALFVPDARLRTELIKDLIEPMTD